MSGHSPTSRARRPMHATIVPVLQVVTVDGLDRGRLLHELVRALARQAAQELFSQQDGARPATAGGRDGNDG